MFYGNHSEGCLGLFVCLFVSCGVFFPSFFWLCVCVCVCVCVYIYIYIYIVYFMEISNITTMMTTLMAGAMRGNDMLFFENT